MIHIMQIRAEKVPDAGGIRAVHTAAFAPSGNEANLVDALRGAGQATVSLVAIEQGRLVGHILFSPVTLTGPARLERGLGLAPLAVLPEFQRQAIGTQLALRGLEVCRAAGFEFVVVLGNPAYYGRFRFRPASQFHLTNEYDAEAEFMALELRPGALAGAGGLAQFRPEFRANHC
jgi:putative acetyltransferase